MSSDAAAATNVSSTTTTTTTTATTTNRIERYEILAYANTAERGDVLPACMRLVMARAVSAWADRTSLALVVGPACRGDVLDMACTLMPRAVEPRLLRAASSMSNASRATAAHERDAWMNAARGDLDEASRLDPNDVTVRILLAELARAASHPFHARTLACVA